jgi:hypothetical protein
VQLAVNLACALLAAGWTGGGALLAIAVVQLRRRVARLEGVEGAHASGVTVGDDFLAIQTTPPKDR